MQGDVKKEGQREWGCAVTMTIGCDDGDGDDGGGRCTTEGYELDDMASSASLIPSVLRIIVRSV